MPEGEKVGTVPSTGPERRTVRSDLKRIVPVWLVLLVVALVVIWLFGKCGSWVLARLAYTSPVAYEVAQVYRADGTEGWQKCLLRVDSLREPGKRLDSAVGVLKDDPVLEKAREDLLRSWDMFKGFEDVPGMLAQLALWDGDVAESYAWRGMEASARKNWDEALMTFTVAAGMGETTAQVEEGRLEALVRLGRWDAATSTALALQDKEFITSRYYHLVADIHFQQGDADGMEAALRKAIELNPLDTRAVERLADVFVFRGRLQEADELYQGISRNVTNNAELYHRHALLAIRRNRLEEAAGLYRKAIKLEPNIYVLHYELAQLYLKMGKPTRAQPHLNRAFELNPKRFEQDQAKGNG